MRLATSRRSFHTASVVSGHPSVVRKSRFMNHAEPIAVGIGKHDVVGPIRIAPIHTLCAEVNQAFDFRPLIAGVEVEVMALVVLRTRRHLRDRHLRSHPVARDKDRPIVRRFTQWPIVQGRAPELDGPPNITYTPND